MKTFTIKEIATKTKKDRSTVLRWIGKNLFPNAKLRQAPSGEYWEIPVSDFERFEMPKRGGKR